METSRLHSLITDVELVESAIESPFMRLVGVLFVYGQCIMPSLKIPKCYSFIHILINDRVQL